MVKTKAELYIVKTFDQLIHLFITMCEEKKMSVSHVIRSANRMRHAVFKNALTVKGKL